MTKIFTCGECRYYSAYSKYACYIRTGYHPEKNDVCQYFKCKNGKNSATSLDCCELAQNPDLPVSVWL